MVCRVATLAACGCAAAPVPLAGQATLRVVAYNIRHGAGMDLEVDLERIADVLRPLDADVIALQEVDDGTERTDRVDQVGRLAELLGMRGFHGPHRAYQGGQYGNALLTRLPVLAERTRPIPSRPDGRLTVHEIEVAVGREGRRVSVVSVHLAGTPEERRAQADTLSAFFEEATHPVVLAGDFNSRRGDLVVRRLEEAWLILRKEGDADTFPADAPDREIDYVMVRPPEPFEVVEHVVVPETMAADHRPLLAVLRIW